MYEFIADKTGKLSKLALYNVQDLSYSALMKLLRNKDVKVNEKRISKDLFLNKGDRVVLYYTPQKIQKFSVIYEDENVLILDKKRGYESIEVYNDLLIEKPSAKFVHRLDRNTDGLMIFALNVEAEKELLTGFKNHSFEKKYLATVFGKMPRNKDLLTAYLVKDSDKSEVKIFDKKVPNSVVIKTGYQVIEEGENASKLLVTLYTGKTHQIRAHLAHVGNFIIGDGKYGDAKINKIFNVKSQMLSSYSLSLKFDETSELYYLNNKTFTIKR